MVRRLERVPMAMLIGQICSYIALAFGILFFLFACKYYVAILIALFSGTGGGKNNVNANGGNWNGDAASWNMGASGFPERDKDVKEKNYAFNPDGQKRAEPFISIQLPFYNEKNVARRIIHACVGLDYSNYEIVVADDSRDETIEILKELNKREGGPTIKSVHRKDRSGFKGGALQKAVDFMDPRTRYVVVFDADFIPPPYILRRFLRYFEGENGNFRENGDRRRFAGGVSDQHGDGKEGNGDCVLEKVNDWFDRQRIGVVQGYQLHHLNKNENWITKGVRAEFSGGYMIERVAEEFFGSMKMITGSVFMIRADILRKLGWTTSITEDWDLTLRMYMEGYKVLYTPLIQAPAEIPTTIRTLARQRMRWAEGHTFAVKKYFWDVLRSNKLTWREKLEFVYFSPYYLQSFFFLTGTLLWFIAEFLGQHPFFWTATFGWCLILSNLFSLPLMGLSGLYLEQTAREDFTGVFSFVVLSYLLTPFQAYAAIKGLLERDEGGWIRTFKTGSITDRVLQVKLRRIFSWILPRREAPSSPMRHEERRRNGNPSAMALVFLIAMSTIIVWVTAAAMSIQESGCRITALSFEYVEPVVVANTVPTNNILTHPDYTDLGSTLHSDYFTLSSSGWREAWSFYLHSPLEQDYILNGRLTFILYLRADEETEVDIMIKVREVAENGNERDMVNDKFDGVKLEDSPSCPVVLEGKAVNSKKYLAGRSILAEIWLNPREGEGITCFFDYGSGEKHSRIEFPGIVMPESLLPLMIVSPLIPLAVLRMKAKREKKHTGRVEENGLG